MAKAFFRFNRIPYTIDCSVYGIPDVSELKAVLSSTGHIRFRGLNLSNAQELESKYGHFIGTPMKYKGGSEFRDNLGSTKRVLEAGYIPPYINLAQHNEMAYTDQWPQLFALGCIENTLPSHQGITPICDNKKLTEHLPTDLYDKYMDLGVRYMRTQIDMDKMEEIAEEKRKEYTPWQKTFMTECKEDVERECERNGYKYRWNEDGSLYYEYVRPSFVRHPEHGDICLFNTLNGVDWYDTGKLELKKRPYWNQWGNGQDFNETEKRTMRGLYEEFTMGDTWKSGDLLLLDNFYTTHGRTPFNPKDGKRVIGVMMGNQVVRTSFDPKGVGLCEYAR